MPYKVDQNHGALLLQIPKNLKFGHVNNTKAKNSEK